MLLNLKFHKMCEISVPSKMSTPRGIETGVLHGSILLFILQSVGKRFPPFPGIYQAFLQVMLVYTQPMFSERYHAVSYFHLI